MSLGVGTHVEKLADWSRDQVRADIVKCGEKPSGPPALMAFI